MERPPEAITSPDGPRSAAGQIEVKLVHPVNADDIHRELRSPVSVSFGDNPVGSSQSESWFLFTCAGHAVRLRVGNIHRDRLPPPQRYDANRLPRDGRTVRRQTTDRTAAMLSSRES